MANRKHHASDLTIYTASLVNPYKLTILLEELGVPYTPHIVNVMEKENQSDWYTKINPNGKLPALKHRRLDGAEFLVWESAACLQYIADVFDTEHKFSFPTGTQEYYQMLSWLAFQVSGIGPYFGQAVHFLNYAYENNPYGIKRYVAESRRLFGVIEKHLAQSGGPDDKPLDYLVGNKLTIADIACFPWVASAWYFGVDIDDYPAASAWRERMAAREGFKRGMEVPTPFFARDEVTKDPAGEEMRKAVQGAVTEMIKQESAKHYKEPGRGYREN